MGLTIQENAISSEPTFAPGGLHVIKDDKAFGLGDLVEKSQPRKEIRLMNGKPHVGLQSALSSTIREPLTQRLLARNRKGLDPFACFEEQKVGGSQ